MRSLVLFACILLTGSESMSQLSQVVHQFANALERRQQVDVIYLDFSEAFDRVSHKKPLFRLECLGIGGSLLAWFSGKTELKLRLPSYSNAKS